MALSTHAAAAKAIRAELKKNGVNASVRAKSYTGGDSVTVDVEQDLLPAAVDQLRDFCQRFQMGHFNGMEDLYEYSNTSDDLPQVKFVFVNVHYSEETREAAREFIGEIDGLPEHEVSRYEYMALAGTWGDFWTSRKPRVRAAA